MNSWADSFIRKLSQGEREVQFRPSGNSMIPRIRSGQLCTVQAIAPDTQIKPGDVVLCTVKSRDFLHIVKATLEGRFLIGNARGRINGWTTRDKIYGVLSAVTD